MYLGRAIGLLTESMVRRNTCTIPVPLLIAYSREDYLFTGHGTDHRRH